MKNSRSLTGKTGRRAAVHRHRGPDSLAPEAISATLAFSATRRQQCPRLPHSVISLWPAAGGRPVAMRLEESSAATNVLASDIQGKKSGDGRPCRMGSRTNRTSEEKLLQDCERNQRVLTRPPGHARTCSISVFFVGPHGNEAEPGTRRPKGQEKLFWRWHSVEPAATGRPKGPARCAHCIGEETIPNNQLPTGWVVISLDLASILPSIRGSVGETTGTDKPEMLWTVEGCRASSACVPFNTTPRNFKFVPESVFSGP